MNYQSTMDETYDTAHQRLYHQRPVSRSLFGGDCATYTFSPSADISDTSTMSLTSVLNHNSYATEPSPATTDPVNATPENVRVTPDKVHVIPDSPAATLIPMTSSTPMNNACPTHDVGVAPTANGYSPLDDTLHETTDRVAARKGGDVSQASLDVMISQSLDDLNISDVKRLLDDEETTQIVQRALKFVVPQDIT